MWAHTNQAKDTNNDVCHVHKKCLQTWLERKNTCPTCRAEVNPYSFFSWKEKTIHNLTQFINNNKIGTCLGVLTGQLSLLGMYVAFKYLKPFNPSLEGLLLAILAMGPAMGIGAGLGIGVEATIKGGINGSIRLFKNLTTPSPTPVPEEIPLTAVITE